MCWRGFSEGRGCPSLLLLLGSGFMLLLLLSAGEVIYERRLIVEKLRVCVCVCLCRCISRFVRIQCVCVFLCVSASEAAGLISNCFSCRHRRMAGGQTCCNPLTPLFHLIFLLLSLPVSLCSFPLCLSLFIFFYLSASVNPPPPQQQGAVLGGMTLKCGDCSYITGACGWAMSACVYVLISVCTNSLCLFACIY